MKTDLESWKLINLLECSYLIVIYFGSGLENWNLRMHSKFHLKIAVYFGFFFIARILFSFFHIYFYVTALFYVNYSIYTFNPFHIFVPFRHSFNLTRKASVCYKNRIEYISWEIVWIRRENHNDVLSVCIA